MPKMKTRSGAKKRFRLTGSGKVKMAVAFKRHGMRKRPTKMLRQHTGTKIMSAQDAARVKKYFMPNG
ncbi:50S ribosomal protein L35 [Oceanibaculum sp.]|uniref:50S ribosomal protein L35 n=1 Tax=Oceanibaculum sp. TaxID=1903597 RepID=UPI002589BC04|nr:50S ribosomal protein L35 [Oceanibaculum sp.]MCH2395372.1 50S ribosomal protein L35 [Oceanibaculum sp.]